MTTAHFDTVAASPAAYRWVKKWCADAEGEILHGRQEIADAAGEFLGAVVRAYYGGYLRAEKNPAGEYYQSVPREAEFILIKGAVRRGFILKRGDAIWIGYSVAGTGTATYAWPATQTEYAALMAFLQ